MNQKQVKITGLKINRQLGILQAVDMKFDENNKLTVFKGETGSGKTTVQKSIQLGTQGSRTLTDKNLYGDIDVETQLLDGDQKIYVGCKTNKQGKLNYIIYMRDDENNKVKNPVIDGVKATPSKYLETLQTKLTWRMDELTSENPTTQRNILFELYKAELEKVGVDQMVKKIDEAKRDRDVKDMKRKEVGGISEDLRAKGYDPNRPDTLPTRESTENIDAQIREIEKQKTTKQVEAKSQKENKLSEIKAKAAEVTNKCFAYNRDLEAEYNKKKETWEKEQKELKETTEYYYKAESALRMINDLNRLSEQKLKEIKQLMNSSINYIVNYSEPTKPAYIANDDQKITADTPDIYDSEAGSLVQELIQLRKQYAEIESQPVDQIDTTEFDQKIDNLDQKRKQAEDINKICDAVNAFQAWKDANDAVQELNKEYARKLAEVETGVEGLRIVPEESESGKLDIYLMYNGHYDPDYFRNPEKQYRKLSSYSGTQKPMIALLVQNYLLSRKPKALRYLFVDDHPIDNRTRKLLEKMCNELDIHIFVNVTGDFDVSDIKDGEMLIEGGELILNKNKEVSDEK